MDNLSRDVREALRLGYGCHYGHYKADYPNTAEPDPEQVPKHLICKCKVCGQEFEKTHGNRLFCSDKCRSREKQRQKKLFEDRPKLPVGPAVCPVCGGTFQRTMTHRRKVYCRPSCAATARNRERKNKRETSSDGES